MAAIYNRSRFSQPQQASPGGDGHPLALWILQGLLAAVFLMAGVTKLLMSSADLTADIALPVAFLRFIGVCEVLGAVGLVAPGIAHIRRGLTPLAAAALVIIMIGATVVTIATGDMLGASFPLAVGVLAALVVRGRWSWFTAA